MEKTIITSTKSTSDAAKQRPAFLMSREFVQLASTIQHLANLFPNKASRTEDENSIFITWKGHVKEFLKALNLKRSTFYALVKQYDKSGLMSYKVNYGDRSITFTCSKLVIFAEALG